MLRDLGRSTARGPPRRRRSGAPPSVAVLEVAALDADGEPLARLASEPEDTPPRIRLLAGGARAAAPGRRRSGARATVVAGRRGRGRDHPPAAARAAAPGRPVAAWPRRSAPRADRRWRPRRAAGARAGQHGRRPGRARGRRAGCRRGARARSGEGDRAVWASPDEPGAISLFAAQSVGLPIAFPPEVEAEAAAAQPVALGKRIDLRALPLVTIDGADARDFDDAVYAEPDADPANPGGWHLVVAIADVAHYVRAGRRAGPGGQAARQLGLFPGPGAADAAGGAVQRPVLAAAGRGPRLPRGAPVVRPARAQAPASLRARADALARAAHLRAGAGGGRRRARRDHGASARERDPPAVRRLCGAGQGAPPARHPGSRSARGGGAARPGPAARKRS